MKNNNEISIFWFRRDLRLSDNAGLYQALKASRPVLPIFIFDKEILDDLNDKSDARVTFIHNTISEINEELKKYNSSLLVKYGKTNDVYSELKKEYKITAVYTNHDYEPYAIKRDLEIKKILEKDAIAFYTFKDQVIFEKEEILSDAGNPYKVYTPYKNKWLSRLNDFYLKSYPTEKYHNNFFKTKPFYIPSLKEIGFVKTSIALPSKIVNQGLIKKYDEQRDFPYIEGTSRLGIHLRFGTVSIREKARKAILLNQVWLSELIWREFFMQLLYHFPVVVSNSFNSKFEKVTWRRSEEDFKIWCEGMTGYPLVDAGIRELNQTGHMHNRVRMVVASFLTKHLFIDWRWGEAYFAQKLLDYDLSANNGNWQWCAGTGADAQPYFRIFNPTSQQEKFDPNFEYIKKWVPEFGTDQYPTPMIDHKIATTRAKELFSVLK